MSFKDLPIMQDKKKGVLLFYPYVSKKTPINIKKKLSGRWLGQGPMVDKFENEFKKICEKMFCYSDWIGYRLSSSGLYSCRIKKKR